jgi:hypothetical protein
MPSVEKYRRAWFALVRETGLCEEDRHWLQESLTGKPSSRTWSLEDWDRAVAALQRDLGQHNDFHAHLKEDENDGKEEARRTLDNVWATPSQARFIERLADEIDWKAGRERGPFLYLRKSSLKGGDAELRRVQLGYVWDEGARGTALWSALTRKEAADFIRALLHLREVSPRRERGGGAGDNVGM